MLLRLCIVTNKNKKSLSFLPQMWIGHSLTCLLTEPKEGLWPALYERWKRLRGRNRGSTEQQACKTVCQFIIKMGPRARLLSTTCLEPGNYRTTMLKTLWVASAFSSFYMLAPELGMIILPGGPLFLGKSISFIRSLGMSTKFQVLWYKVISSLCEFT